MPKKTLNLTVQQKLKKLDSFDANQTNRSRMYAIFFIVFFI